ncbi:MAG: TIGR02147 family protein [Fibrobacter sp.]|nr:TIGR02147 family protein [Fibrobacter sp.]
MKPITSYTDYRTYLRDFITVKKAEGVQCSNRWFARKMQINSSSWLTSILKGNKGLSKETANRLSEVLKHTPAETRYFETLVAFNQARKLKERSLLYEELSNFQKSSELGKHTVKNYELYSCWYHSAVWSLLGMYDFKKTRNDLERLGSMLSPQISLSQVKKSVKLLEQTGLITEKEGFLRHTCDAITTGENTRSLAVANFQLETMRLAQEAIDRYTCDERYIATVTAGVSRKAYEQIKQLLIDTGNQIALIANADSNSDRVYQINFQAFPITRAGEKKAEAEIK